ncbi:MAG: phage baseplate assembly protein V [Vibrio sp.]
MNPQDVDSLVTQKIKAALTEYDEKITELIEENSELKRRLDNSIRFGIVSEVSGDAKKIKVKHGQRFTPFIRWFTCSGGDMMHYRCPSVGESVLLLDTSCGLGANGYVALCGFESDKFSFPDASPKKIITKAGGMTVEWDLDSETMTLTSSLIKLNEQNLAGVVTGFNKCAFTGLQHPDCSKTVLSGQ